MSPQKARYGTWSSVITAEKIARGTATLTDVIVDPLTSSVYHIESRPSENGRSVLVNSTTGTDVIGQEWNVRTGVHEYGGGAAIVYNSVAYFSHYADGKVYKVEEGEDTPKSITPDNKPYRYANLVVHPVHSHLLVAVLEDHTVDLPSAVVTTLCVIDSKARSIQTLVSGADFYASPTFSPDGTRFAWQQWSHPDMPWEGAEIHIADVVIDSEGKLGIKNDVHVAGERINVSSAFPLWATNDTLVFTSDQSGYINPWKYSYSTKKASALFDKPMEKDFGSPGWSFSIFPYAILDKEGEFALFAAAYDGRSAFFLVDLSGGKEPQLLETPYVGIHSPRSISRERNEVAFIGEKVDQSPSIVRCSLTIANGPASANISLSSIKPPPSPLFPVEFVSTPRPITLQAPDGEEKLHVIYYGPHNPNYEALSLDEKPPCIVHVHGGPTGVVGQGLSWKTQYFTSRGWAWLDVNYGGSSGYGRAYIKRLEGKWGIVDVEDCIHAVRTLSRGQYNLIDPKRVVIRGGSAGGYTVLAALTIGSDLTAFAAGTSSYGVSDLKMLCDFTHKFESRYLEKLVGGTYEQVPELYRERSPITHADKIVAPLLILQGEIDKVVPKEQAETIHESIKSRGGVVEYKLYPGEGHGWRQEKNIADSLDREIAFYEKVLGLRDETAKSAM